MILPLHHGQHRRHPVDWDLGVAWFSRLVTPPMEEPLGLEYVSAKVLRVSNDGYDSDFVARCITAAREQFEAESLRAAMRQTWALTLDRFPQHWVELPRPPLIEVVSVDYFDTAGEPASLAVGSPSVAQFRTVPSGEFVPARIIPLRGASWPATDSRPDAVTITYDCGYEFIGSPEVSSMPARYLAGMCLLVAELYKQRELSVDGRLAPATVQTDRFWRRVW
jgi:uncharacterized phiE125 gp8 family phage protein